MISYIFSVKIHTPEIQAAASIMRVEKSKKNRGRKLGTEAYKLLGALIKAGVQTVADLIEVSKYDKFVSEKVYKKLWHLEKQGYVEKTKTQGNRSFFNIAPRGRLSFLKYLHLEKLKTARWDGNWRVIIFDIPEKLKKWREFLRSELKDLGFVSLQESVYLTPYAVTKDLDRFLNEWRLRKYVRYLTVSEIDDAVEFKEKFDLN